MKDDAHRNFISNLPCAICGDDTTVECAHVRFGDIRVAKSQALGKKPSDAFTMPLCGRHHREQHGGNERMFWKARRYDPILVSLALYAVSGDLQTGEKILSFWRPHGQGIGEATASGG